MNRVLVFIILFLFFILATSTELNAAGALKSVKIYEGIDQRRPQQTSHTLGRRYIWNFENLTHTVSMSIDIERYNSYTSRKRTNLPLMVQEGTDALQDLVREFRRVMPFTWQEERKVNFVLAFVQSLPYTYDDVTTGYDEFRRYAIETLIEGGGDCEDTSVLAASILSGLGFELALISPPGHIAVGARGNFSGSYFRYGNNEYYYCETTGTGWKVGQLPPSYVSRSVTIIPISAQAVQPQPRVIAPEPTPKPVIQPNPPKPSPRPVRKPNQVRRVRHKATSRHVTRQNDSLAAGVFIAIVLMMLIGGGAAFLILKVLRSDKSSDPTSVDASTQSPFDPLSRG